jgi:hypothetical protein
METNIFKHIKINIYKVYVCKNDKKKHIFIIEYNLQKVGHSFFHLSRWTTVNKDLLVQRQVSLVSDKR